MIVSTAGRPFGERTCAGSFSRRLARVVMVIGSLAATAAAAADPPVKEPPAATRLELVTGSVDGGVLEGLSKARCAWRGADGRRLDVPTDSVVAWGRCPPWPQEPMVLLVGGGVIAGTIEAIDASTAVVRSAALGRLELPAAAVAGFRRSIATGPTAAMPPVAGGPRVRIELANGDRLEGRRLALREGSVRIETGGPDGDEQAEGVAAPPRDVTIPMAVVRGIDLTVPAISDRGHPPVPLPRILVALDDGSRFPVDSVAIPAGDPLASAVVVLFADGRPVACDCDREAIVAVAVDGGGGRFLASLEPVEFSHAPTFGRSWPLARDRTLAGGWLSARGITAFSGLGIHGPARVRYRLDAPARRFESLVAIDDSAGQGGGAIVRVRARGGAGPWREVFASGVLRGAEEPVAIRAALEAATEIELVVEPVPRDGGGLPGGILDRTIWLDPRVVADR
jgi:hypothetical protein